MTKNGYLIEAPIGIDQRAGVTLLLYGRGRINVWNSHDVMSVINQF